MCYGHTEEQGGERVDKKLFLLQIFLGRHDVPYKKLKSMKMTSGIRKRDKHLKLNF